MMHRIALEGVSESVFNQYIHKTEENPGSWQGTKHLCTCLYSTIKLKELTHRSLVFGGFIYLLHPILSYRH